LRKHKAVFLDRDGVLNQAIVREGKPYSPTSLAELVIPEGVLAALTDLKAAGFLLIGATNQPDVARGTTPQAVVEALNAELMAQLPLDEIRVCFHDDSDDCECRKPKAGLLLEAAEEHDIELAKSVMVGDRWKDIAAGQTAGCKTVWINHSYQEPGPKVPPDFTATTLQASAAWIIENL
jgi:D-glycero-D-manno-heptose 1,7-bisphosphate phosphatase